MNKADSSTSTAVSQIQLTLALNTIDFHRLKADLIALFKYLCSEVGRTHDNCNEVGRFFSTEDTWVSRDLPENFHKVFALMSEALHDTITHPELTKECGCTPEQLLLLSSNLDAH